MHVVYEVLSKFGLRELGDLPKVGAWKEPKIRQVHDRLYSTLLDAQKREDVREGVGLDPFKFVASASKRGDAGCSEPSCRYKKLDFLGRYAALYATSVVVPLSLTSPDQNYAISFIRPRLEAALFTLLSSRVLVNSGRFIPVVLRTAHCEHEMVHVELVLEVIGDFMDWAAEEFAGDFSVSYHRPENSPSGLPSIYIDGPEDFVEHGSIVYLERDGKVPRLSRRRKFDSEGMTRIRGRQKLPFLSPIFEQIGQNTSFSPGVPDAPQCAYAYRPRW